MSLDGARLRCDGVYFLPLLLSLSCLYRSKHASRGGALALPLTPASFSFSHALRCFFVCCGWRCVDAKHQQKAKKRGGNPSENPFRGPLEQHCTFVRYRFTVSERTKRRYEVERDLRRVPLEHAIIRILTSINQTARYGVTTVCTIIRQEHAGGHLGCSRSDRGVGVSVCLSAPVPGVARLRQKPSVNAGLS